MANGICHAHTAAITARTMQGSTYGKSIADGMSACRGVMIHSSCNLLTCHVEPFLA
jgi:hypothetical protein